MNQSRFEISVYKDRIPEPHLTRTEIFHIYLNIFTYLNILIVLDFISKKNQIHKMF